MPRCRRRVTWASARTSAGVMRVASAARRRAGGPRGAAGGPRRGAVATSLRTSVNPFAWMPDTRGRGRRRPPRTGSRRSASGGRRCRRRCRKVESSGSIAGQLGRLAAEQRAPGGRQTSPPRRRAPTSCRGGPRSRRHVVEEEQRLGAGDEHVVDALRDQVGDRVVLPGAARDHELRADAVGRDGEQSPSSGAYRPAKPPMSPTVPGVRVDSTAARSRSTRATAFSSETPAES